MPLSHRFPILHVLCVLILCLFSLQAESAQDCVAGTWQSPPNDIWGEKNGAYPVRAESQHFQMRWAPENAALAQQDAEAALHVMEEILAWFVSDTVNWPTPYCNDTVKYKAQIFVDDSYGLSGSGAGGNVPGMWVGSFAVRGAARGDVGGMVHEFTHSMQYNTGGLRRGQRPGWMWESHAEFMAHQYPGNSNKTGCAGLGAWQPHLHYGTSRTRYCAWMFWDFVKNDMGFDAVNRIWTSTASIDDQDPLLAFRDANGLTQSELQDLFGRYAMANVNWDYTDRQDGFDRGSAYRSSFGSNTQFSGDQARYLRLARLETIDQAQRRFVVSDYFAPQRYGYNLVRLIPDASATQITIDFRGVVQDSIVADADFGELSLEPETPGTQWMDDSMPRDPASDWRWGVVAIDREGVSRYSPLMRGAEGQLSFALNGDEREVYLTVAATPDEHHSIFWDQKYHTVYRYPYKVQLAGALPEGFQPGYRSEIRNGYPDGRVHVNGGGWVANNAQVDASVYVGPNAAVLGGIVRDNARIEDYAAVWSGEVRDNAVIGGATQLNRNLTVAGNAEIRVVVGDGHTFEARNGLVDGSTKLFGDLILAYLGDTALSRGAYSGYFNRNSASGPQFGADRPDFPVEVTAAVDSSWPDDDRVQPTPEPAPPPESNLAPAANLATSFVSAWEQLAAVNNDSTHVSSADKSGGAYGNWRGQARYGETNWVSFSWETTQSLGAFEVYWWIDGRGIAAPNTASVEYWNGSAWVALGNVGVARNQFNRLEFASVSTTSVRLAMSGNRATGILEARVLASAAPAQPESDPVNIAPAAALEASYVSPWESLAAATNESDHDSSADKTGGAYGNWRGTAGYGQTDWISFRWDSTQRLTGVEVYWWNDGRGIAVPDAATVEYWDGSRWIALDAIGTSLDQFNGLEFSPLETTGIRVLMSSFRSTGILEARVWSR